MSTITATEAYEAMLEHHKRLREGLAKRADVVSGEVAAGRRTGPQWPAGGCGSGGPRGEQCAERVERGVQNATLPARIDCCLHGTGRRFFAWPPAAGRCSARRCLSPSACVGDSTGG